MSFEWGLEQERDLEQGQAVQAALPLGLPTAPGNSGSTTGSQTDAVQNPGKARCKNHSAEKGESWSD